MDGIDLAITLSCVCTGLCLGAAVMGYLLWDHMVPKHKHEAMKGAYKEMLAHRDEMLDAWRARGEWLYRLVGMYRDNAQRRDPKTGRYVEKPK